MKQGIITFLDILGWKGIWQRDSQPDPIASLKTLINIAKDYAAGAKGYKEKLAAANKATIPTDFEFETISISDTIVLISSPYTFNADSNEVAFSVRNHIRLCRILIRQSIILGIPIRGAVGIGSFRYDGNILVGEAVDEVASWHEVADMIGVVAAPSVFLHPDLPKDWLLDYVVPSSKSKPFKSAIVDWKEEWENPLQSAVVMNTVKGVDRSKKTRADLLAYFQKMGPIVPELYPKFSNTLDFYDCKRADNIIASPSTKVRKNNVK